MSAADRPSLEGSLREGVEAIADQLCYAVDGRFDFTVHAPVEDESCHKLAMLVNFVLDAARRALADLEDRNARLAELDRLKSDFLANISHELRTPLALILGPTEQLLASDHLAPADRRNLERVSRSARTLLRHVSDLLDISKLAAGKMEVSYTSVDLADLVRVTVADFEALAEERRVELVVDLPASLPAEMDPEKIQRVLVNLLANAFKFAPANGKVRVSLCRLADGSPPAARVEVADSGPGVPEHLREVIFERFRQGEGGSTRRFGGTGLGLAIAREFAELHGGGIAIGDAPEGGALFTLAVPLTAPAGAVVRPDGGHALSPIAESWVDACAGEMVRPEVAPPDGVEDRPLVLLVEDNVEMRRFITEALARDYRVFSALDGREGLSRARELPPDLIISDVMMPEMSGDELLRELRADSRFDLIPVLVLTAKADEGTRIRLLSEGAQDFLLKPFSVEELRVRSGNLISAKQARQVLQQEISGQAEDLASLAQRVVGHQRELQETLASLEVALMQAERANQVKTSFLRMVSHELRTPLHALVMQLELLPRLRSAPPSPREQQVADRMGRAVHRLRELIESLLEYARVESGQLIVRLESVDLVRTAESVVEELRPQAELRGLTLTLQHGDNVPHAHTDPRLVRLILVNLVVNALKFTLHGGVEVSVLFQGEGYRLAVRDSGPGIPPDQQAHVFQPFAQLEPLAHKHTPGVGLGLAIVGELAAALGGDVSLESEVGVGSVFAVTLPAFHPENGGENGDASAQPEGEPSPRV